MQAAVGIVEATATADCALTAALARFWASHAARDECFLHPKPLPAFVHASGASITHTALRRWMRRVQDALTAPPDTMRRGAWLVVALAVSPCSVEESALMLLAAETRDCVYVPVDVSLPSARQLELLLTARVDRVVALPQSPLARLLSDVRASEYRATAPGVAAAKPELVVSESEVFQSVLVFALMHGPEPSLQKAVNESRLRPDSNAASEANAVPAPLYVLFTSGSTGEPKGVLGTRAGAWNRMQWMWTRYPFDAGKERVVRAVKLTFIDSVWEILGAFLQHIPLVHVADPVTFSGGSSGFGDSYHVVLSERCHFLERMLVHAVTRLTVVPSVLELLLVQKSRCELQSALASLRFLLVSGETLPLKLALQINDKLPHVTMLNLYGSTEVAGDVTFVELPRPITSEHVAVWSEHGVPIGTTEAVIGWETSILLVDEVGTSMSLPIECPSTLGEAGMKGEMWVSGHPIALGYVSPAGFAEFFGVNDDCSQPRQHPGSCKWFKTGDICAVVGNYLYFCGRRDRLVKIRGLGIQLEAIERAVLQALTDLGNGNPCQVVAFDVDVETKYGFDHRQLIVCIAEPTPSTRPNEKVPSSRDTLSFSSDPRKADICRWIAEKYGPASVPHSICAIPSGAVDRLPNGKLDRRGLAVRYVKSLRAVLPSSGDLFADPISEYVRIQLRSLLQISDCEWEGAVSSTPAALGMDSLLTTLFHFELHQQFPALTISSTELAETPIVSLVARLQNLQANIQMGYLATRAESKPVVPIRKRKRVVPFYEPATDAQSTDFPSRLEGLSRSNQTSSGSKLIPTCQVFQPPSTHPSTASRTFQAVPKMELAWFADLKKCVDASPLVVLAQTSDSSALRRAIVGSHAGIVICVDIDREGEQLWKAQLDDRVEASATLSLQYEIVYVGTYAGTLFALDLHSGSTRWSYQCGGMIKSAAVPVDELDIVIVGAYDHKLRAMSADTGSPIWTFDVGASIFSSPVLVRDAELQFLLCATTRGDLVSLSVTDGPCRQWGRKLPAPIFAGLSVDASLDLAVVGCADGKVYGLTASTGDARWTVATDKPVFSSPCLYRYFVIIGSHDGYLRKIDAVSGRVVWATLLDSAIFSSPTVFRAELSALPSSVPPSSSHQEPVPSSTEATLERLFCCIATTGGRVYIIDERGGDTINCVQSIQALDESDRPGGCLGEIFSSPVVVGDCCLVGTRANLLLALRLAFEDAAIVEE